MTLGELRQLLRLTLADTTAWPDATLDRWTQAAIPLYSGHFPRRYRAELALSAGTQAYAVPGGLSSRGAISVEYPAGEAPPRYLRCVARSSPLFGAGGACYAVQGVEADEVSAVGWIVFAEAVADGETAIVE